MSNAQQQKNLRNEGRISLEFNIRNEKPKFACNLLKQMGRKKAIYLADLIWAYENGLLVYADNTESDNLPNIMPSNTKEKKSDSETEFIELDTKVSTPEEMLKQDDKSENINNNKNTDDFAVDLGVGSIGEVDEICVELESEIENDSSIPREAILNSLKKMGLG